MNSQQMWGYGNHLKRLCQDHEKVYALVYHTDHHKDQDLLWKQLSFSYFQKPVYQPIHISDGVWKGSPPPVDGGKQCNIVHNKIGEKN